MSLIYWLPQYGSWADQDGNPTNLPAPESGRRVTLVEQNGEQVAALVYDATLGEEPELVEAVSAAAASPWKMADSKQSCEPGCRNCTAHVPG